MRAHDLSFLIPGSIATLGLHAVLSGLGHVAGPQGSGLGHAVVFLVLCYALAAICTPLGRRLREDVVGLGVEHDGIARRMEELGVDWRPLIGLAEDATPSASVVGTRLWAQLRATPALAAAIDATEATRARANAYDGAGPAIILFCGGVILHLLTLDVGWLGWLAALVIGGGATGLLVWAGVMFTCSQAYELHEQAATEAAASLAAHRT